MLDKKAWPKISSKINLSVNDVKAATTFMNALKNILKQKSGEIMNFITLLLS